MKPGTEKADGFSIRSREGFSQADGNIIEGNGMRLIWYVLAMLTAAGAASVAVEAAQEKPGSTYLIAGVVLAVAGVFFLLGKREARKKPRA